MINFTFKGLIGNIQQCTLCSTELPHRPRPVIQGSPSATVLIIGQAPGFKVHRTGIPFNDPSGDRLRSWLNLSPSDFYDESKIAIMPVGLCFPGRDKVGADLPPLKRCAPFWHSQLLHFFSNIRITLLVGSYAQNLYLRKRCKPSLTQTVQAFEEYLPEYFPLFHPSWRNVGWLKSHPWFESIVLPQLRERVHKNL